MATSLQEIAANTQGLGSGTGSMVSELQNIVTAINALDASWSEVTITPAAGITDNGSHLYVRGRVGILLLDLTNSSGATINANSVIATVADPGYCRHLFPTVYTGGIWVEMFGTDLYNGANYTDGTRLRGGGIVYMD